MGNFRNQILAMERNPFDRPWAENGRENCCGVFSIEFGVMLIGIFLLAVTAGFVMLGFYYEHFIFFAPLVGLLGLYSIFFVVHKTIPGKDNAESRRGLFFLVLMITLATVAYGILFANEIFNKVPTEMCENQVTMDKKECTGWLTGIPGNLGVIILSIMMLYFSYI